jgi:hypothetical protein
MPSDATLFLASLRLVIFGVFTAASANKVYDFRSFVDGVKGYKLVPASWSVPFSCLLIAAEVFVALGHLTRGTLVAGAVAGCLLLTSFGLAIALTLLRGASIRCHCIGASETVNGGHLVRVGLLFTAEIAILAAGPTLNGDLWSLPAIAFAIQMATLFAILSAASGLAALWGSAPKRG